MRIRHGIGIALLAAGAVACAQSGGSTPPVRPHAFFQEVSSFPARDRGLNKPTLDALEKPIDKYLLENVPFDQALEQFSKLAHVNMHVDWAAIEADGTARRTPVTVNLAQVPARRVLAVVLAIAGAPNADLHFLVMDNILEVSTKERLHSDRYQITSSYDIRPLFADVEFNSREGHDIAQEFLHNLTNGIEYSSWREQGGNVGDAWISNGFLIVRQAVDIQEEVAAFVAEFKEGRSTVTRGYDVRDLVKESTQPAIAGGPPNRMDALINAVQTTCGRDTWREHGGKSSSIAAFDGKILVTANLAVQQQVEELLGLMRKKD